MDIGIFSLSGCSGCQIEFLNLEDGILEALKHLDIKEAQILVSLEHPGNFDISFVEGSPTTVEEIEKLYRIRERSTRVVAMGACACYGGVQALIGGQRYSDAVKRQYGGVLPVVSIPPKGIDNYVDVDAKLYGCPFEREELLRLITDLVAGREFRVVDHSVCTECVLKENGCLLDMGEPCMGPVTRGGCSARCPSRGMFCTGCRGEYEDENVDAHVEDLLERGFSMEEIEGFYNKYYRRLRA